MNICLQTMLILSKLVQWGDSIEYNRSISVSWLFEYSYKSYKLWHKYLCCDMRNCNNVMESHEKDSDQSRNQLSLIRFFTDNMKLIY